MGDDDLARLSGDIASLVPNARDALRLEMQRRGLSVEGLDWDAQPLPEKVEESGGGIRRFFRNFFIFLACDLVYLLLVVGVASEVPGLDFVLLVQGLTNAFLRFSLVLAVLTANPILIPTRFAPQRIKTLWVVGAVAPLSAGLLLAVVVALHLGSLIEWVFWPVVILWIAYGWWRERKK